MESKREWIKLFADTQKDTHEIIKLRCVCERVYEVWSRLAICEHISARAFRWRWEIYMGICTPSTFMAVSLFRFFLLFYRRKWASARAVCVWHERAARTKQRRERDKDSINYICEFKARPHILTRTHEMQMCPIVIGRMPHSSGIHIWRNESSSSLPLSFGEKTLQFFCSCHIDPFCTHSQYTVRKSTQTLIQAKRLENILLPIFPAPHIYIKKSIETNE